MSMKLSEQMRGFDRQDLENGVHIQIANRVALLEDVVEMAKDLRNVLPSSSFWQVKDHDKSWIWCWNELSDCAQDRVNQATIDFGKALAKLEGN